MGTALLRYRNPEQADKACPHGSLAQTLPPPGPAPGWQEDRVMWWVVPKEPILELVAERLCKLSWVPDIPALPPRGSQVWSMVAQARSQEGCSLGFSREPGVEAGG